MSVSASEMEVETSIVKDVDSAEPLPPAVDPSAS